MTSALQLWNYIWGTWVASGSLQGKKCTANAPLAKKVFFAPRFPASQTHFPTLPCFPSRRHFSPWVCITIVIASVGFPSIVTDALGKRRTLDSLSWLHLDDLFTGGNLSLQSLTQGPNRIHHSRHDTTDPDSPPRRRGHLGHLRVRKSPGFLKGASANVLLSLRSVPSPLPAGVRLLSGPLPSQHPQLTPSRSRCLLSANHPKLPTPKRRCSLDPVHHRLAARRCLQHPWSRLAGCSANYGKSSRDTSRIPTLHQLLTPTPSRSSSPYTTRSPTLSCYANAFITADSHGATLHPRLRNRRPRPGANPTNAPVSWLIITFVIAVAQTGLAFPLPSPISRRLSPRPRRLLLCRRFSGTPLSY